MNLSLNSVSPTLKWELEQLYNLSSQNWWQLGDNENLVIWASRSDWSEVVLRITEATHRNINEVIAEVDFYSIQTNNEWPVAKLIPSIQGQLLETLEINEIPYYVTCFEKLMGDHQSSDDISARSGEQIIALGKSVGQIHNITQMNHLQTNKYSRNQRYEEDILVSFENYVEDASLIAERLNHIKEVLWTIPITPTTYGLIHTDIRPRNLHIVNGSPIHYDFDDICFHYYLYDIAVTAFHSLDWIADSDERTAFFNYFIDNYLEGYDSVCPIWPISYEILAKLIELRCIYAYID